MSSAQQHQVSHTQASARSAHSSGGSQPAIRQIQSPNNETSVPALLRNTTSSAQTGHHAAENHSLSLTGPSSFSQDLQNDYLCCPSHGPLLHTSPDPRLQWGPSPMERYLEEGPAAQYALFIRPDTGKFSTVRDCTCRSRIEAEARQQTRTG